MNTDNWKWFRFDEIFNISTYRGETLINLEKGTIPYVSSTESNNGVSSYINNIDVVSKNKITVARNGSVCSAFYQPVDFYPSPDDIRIFDLKEHTLSPGIALFLCTLIEKEKYRYTYGRKFGTGRMKESLIKLPVTPDGSPDWQYMEDFIKDQIIPQLPKKAQKVWLKKYDTTPQKQESMKLNTEDWKWFVPSDIFTEISIAPSSDLNSLELDPFGVNYLSRAVVNNGYECKVKRDESKVTRGNFISVVMVGVPSFAFYQKNDVICSQNILVLRYPAINQYNALFLCTILQKDGYRYSYGRTLSKANFLQTKIKLPVTPSGEPDWQFMEDYIKSLPFSKNLEPSDPKEVVDELVEMKKEMIKMRRALEAQQTPSNLVNYGTVNIYEK